MKQSLTVMVILICAYLSGGFTTAIHSKTGAATGKGVRKTVNTWKNSPWVNPWAGAKRFTAKQSPLNTARVNWVHECQVPSIVTKFDVTVWGTDYQGCSMPAGTEVIDMPDGHWVHIYIQMNWMGGNHIVYVEDHSTGNLYFDDTPPDAAFSFQPQVGHEYTVWTVTHS